jgi:hypothetical protein
VTVVVCCQVEGIEKVLFEKYDSEFWPMMKMAPCAQHAIGERPMTWRLFA